MCADFFKFPRRQAVECIDTNSVDGLLYVVTHVASDTWTPAQG